MHASCGLVSFFRCSPLSADGLVDLVLGDAVGRRLSRWTDGASVSDAQFVRGEPDGSASTSPDSLSETASSWDEHSDGLSHDEALIAQLFYHGTEVSHRRLHLVYARSQRTLQKPNPVFDMLLFLQRMSSC